MKLPLLLAGALALVSVPAVPALAHDAPCPYCNMKVSDDTAAVLKAGRKRIEYKCVYCALAEAKTEYPTGDLTVNAPSEKAGQPVVLKRTGSAWKAFPASATFVSPAKIKHKICQEQARAFTTQAAAQVYAKANGGDVLTLAQLNARVK